MLRLGLEYSILSTLEYRVNFKSRIIIAIARDGDMTAMAKKRAYEQEGIVTLEHSKKRLKAQPQVCYICN